VGRKGKHRGSQGLYPVEAVRRINVIKKMMAEGMTLEDIKHSFVFLKNHIDRIDRELSEILDGLATELTQRPRAESRKIKLQGELNSLRSRAGELVRDVERLGSALTVRQIAGFSS
jgi:DNA-binding transcriptional MerR regulator